MYNYTRRKLDISRYGRYIMENKRWIPPQVLEVEVKLTAAGPSGNFDGGEGESVLES